MKSLKSKLTLAGAFMLPTFAFAQTAIDTTAAVAQIAVIETSVIAVGLALIGAAAVAVGVKWVKGSIFS